MRLTTEITARPVGRNQEQDSDLNHGTPSAAEPQPQYGAYDQKTMSAEISALSTTFVSFKR
jgi:hypothetical protein